MSNYFATPLTAEQFETFRLLTSSLNEVQLAWMSGYLAAVTAQNGVQIPAQVKNEINNSTGLSPITILYGSRTGNGEGLAKKAQKLAVEFGLTATIKNMDARFPKMNWCNSFAAKGGSPSPCVETITSRFFSDCKSRGL